MLTMLEVELKEKALVEVANFMVKIYSLNKRKDKQLLHDQQLKMNISVGVCI